MKKSIIILLVLSILGTIIVLFPYSVNSTHGVVNVIDPLFYAWNISHNAYNMFGGIDQLLNTNIFFPLTNTLAFSDTLWAQSIVTTPIIWLTDNPIFAENIAVLISFPLSALFMFLLSLYLTKNNIASILSGLFFAFSYPRLSQIGHLPMIWNQWLPLYILYLLKFLKEGKKINFIFLCIWYLLAISSSIYFGVFLIPITGTVLIWDFITRMQNHTLAVYKNRFLETIPTLFIFLILLVALNFPYVRLKAEHPELKRSIDDMTHLRATPKDYMSVLPTSLLAPLLPNSINEHVFYPTCSVIFLALLGFILSKKQNKNVLFLWIILGTVSLVLSFGDQQAFSLGSFSTGTLRLPYYYLYTYIPLFQTVRVPARLGIFVILSLCILAAYGIDSLKNHKGYRYIIGAFFCIFIIEIWQFQTAFVSIPLKHSVPEVYSWITQLPKNTVIAELPVSLFYHGIKMEDQLYTPYNALQKSHTYALETYRVYYSSFHKKRMINGYGGYLPDSYNKLTANLENFPSEDTVQNLSNTGVTHVIVHSLQYPPHEWSILKNKAESHPNLRFIIQFGSDYVYEVIGHKE